MPNINLVSISPAQLAGNDHSGPFDLNRFEKKYLAQGDSWFSIGHLPPWSTTNLLQQMVLSRSAVAVNCARPGVELAHMTDTSTARVFLDLLNGVVAWQWDAILVSGGGNDLIDAANTPAGAPMNLRLLLRADEWASPALGATRYLSAPGWATFANHMEDVLLRMLAQRDRSINHGVALVLHTYDFLTARNAPAGIGLGPWLYKALRDGYNIPAADWVALADELINRLAAMWLALASKHAARNLKIVDTRGLALRASAGTTGVSGDWENEIHPTPHGYSRLAQGWRAVLDAL